MNPALEGSEHVGPYRILKAVGAGGSARIDLARIDRAYGFQRHVVIKRPLEHLRADSTVSSSLRREAELGGRLRHPNLVAVLDAGTHDGYDYLALEYVHGSSLRALMQAPEPGTVRALPLSAALAIVIDVARGLHVAHELAGTDGAPLGLVHRDVSPSNVLLGADGTVKLSDFGIAKDTRVSTLSGSMRGTVTYMAPEQCRGHAFDRRADVFSLGVILFEVITARRLFWADNDVASLHKVLSGKVPDPRTLVPSLPPELARVMLAAVAPESSARLATTAELADALEAHAARAGIATGARAIARAMHDALGTRAAPWIELAPATHAMPAVEPDDEPSLVSVIESLAEPPEEPLGSEVFAEAEAPPPIAPPARRRRVLPIVVGLSTIAGIAIAVMLSRTGDDEVPPAARPAPRAVPAAITPPAPAPEPVAEPAIEIQDTEAPAQPVEKRRRKRTPASVPADAGITATSPPDAAIGSGGRTVEWTPTMLLPTDKKKPESK